MRLAIHVLGLELLSIEASTDDEPGDEPGEGDELAGGTCASTPMGFTPSHGDQRWERGSEQ